MLSKRVYLEVEVCAGRLRYSIGGLPVGIWKRFRSGPGIFSRQNLEYRLLNSKFSKI